MPPFFGIPPVTQKKAVGRALTAENTLRHLSLIRPQPHAPKCVLEPGSATILVEECASCDPVNFEDYCDTVPQDRKFRRANLRRRRVTNQGNLQMVLWRPWRRPPRSTPQKPPSAFGRSMQVETRPIDPHTPNPNDAND